MAHEILASNLELLLQSDRPCSFRTCVYFHRLILAFWVVEVKLKFVPGGAEA